MAEVGEGHGIGEAGSDGEPKPAAAKVDILSIILLRANVRTSHASSKQLNIFL